MNKIYKSASSLSLQKCVLKSDSFKFMLFAYVSIYLIVSDIFCHVLVTFLSRYCNRLIRAKTSSVPVGREAMGAGGLVNRNKGRIRTITFPDISSNSGIDKGDSGKK